MSTHTTSTFCLVPNESPKTSTLPGCVFLDGCGGDPTATFTAISISINDHAIERPIADVPRMPGTVRITSTRNHRSAPDRQPGTPHAGRWRFAQPDPSGVMH
jgi:hypothetical protein